jgi:HAD superfamily hydrolase (TIGR01484 family)
VKSLQSALPFDLKKIQGVCLDIDETLSTHGKLTDSAFSTLWKLKEKGLLVVPITGRPAGWCDHIARFWPVDAVVGENGAFTFYMKGGVRRRIDTPSTVKADEQLELMSGMIRKLQMEFPHVQFASDQAYREYDLAVDICEDVKPWSEQEVQKLLEFCRKQNAHAKLSSIHVNIWFGDYDKNKGFDHLLNSSVLDKKIPSDSWLFIGDSPNDEPLFEKFSNSVGVANLKKYLPQLKHPPTWITDASSGAGFVEMVEKLLASR